MKNVVYLDHEQCLMIFKQASENNGRVVIEAKGFSPFEITMEPEYAKKIWDEEECKIRKMITDILGLPEEVICHELRDVLRKG